MQFFCFLATLLVGRVVASVPILFVIGGLATFVLGGLTGVMVAMAPFDFQAHDTFFVVGHLHTVLLGGTVFPIAAGLYYFFPIVAGDESSQITVDSRPRNAGQPVSQLMDVIIEGYQVRFTRGDTGTQVPPTLNEPVGGLAPTPGTFTLNGIIIMRRDQFEYGPLRDMRLLGFDPETDSVQIRLIWHLKFHGHTVSGELTETNEIAFNMDVVP